MPNQFFSPEGDLESYFVSEYWLIDQYIGDQLWTWGSNGSLTLGNATDQSTVSSTPITTSAGGTNWKQVSCGAETTGAIKTDGTLWLWGSGSGRCLGNADTRDKSTPITTFAGGTNWKQVSCGRQKTAAIKTDGTLWTWGYAGRGQLGIAAVSTYISTPITTFTGGTNWRQVEVGYYHTAAIKTDGSLWTWGDYFSDFGQLGRDTYYVWFPTPIFSGAADTPTTNSEDLYTLSAGYSATASIKTDGTLWVWGIGSNGQLGTNDLNNTSTPVTTFTGGTNWKQVSFSKGSFGVYISSAIKTDGTLWTWGSGSFGILGNGAITGNRSTPVTTFAGGTNWKQVSSGGSHTAAIKTDGTLWTWGTGDSGRLGNADTTDKSTPITTFAGGTNWKQVSCGFTFITAIKTDGTLWTWGNGNYGQLGSELENNLRRTPVTTFAGGTNWADTFTTNPEDLYTLSAGINHTAAVKTDGTLWLWGRGAAGKLGNAVTTTGSISTPVTTFAGGTNWKQISFGPAFGDYSAAIKTDGTLWTWGSGSFGTLGNGVTTGNTSTPITTFAGGTNWKQVSSGSNNHTAAIKTDGTLWIWGRTSNGQLGNAVITGSISTPVTTFAGGTNWKQVSAGSAHVAAIKTDGTLWTWGAISRLGIILTGVSLVDNGVSGICNTTAQLTGTSGFSPSPNSGTRITTSSGTGTVTSITNSLLGAASLTASTLPTTGNSDDGFWTLTLPFNISYNGTSYGTIYVGTNSYVTFNSGFTVFSSLSFSNPSDQKIMISAGDRSGQRIYFGTEGTAPNRTYRVVFEGSTSIAGTLGSPTMLWEMTFYENATSQIDIQVGINNIFSAVTPSNISTPVTTFVGGTNWKQVSACNSTAAIKTDGTLWVWGIGSNGRLGNASLNNTSTPITTFAGGTNWKQVSSGDSHMAAVKTDGTLWTWGNGPYGQLGNLTNTVISTPVTTFAGGTNWKQVSSGGQHTIALKDTGGNKELFVFGSNFQQQLGINIQSFTFVSTPVTTFAGGTNWKQADSGSNSGHILAVKTDGTLWSWGFNGNGELGNGILSNVFTPITTFAGGTNWKQASAGRNHSLAVKTDGTLWVWGAGNTAELGIGPKIGFSDISTPVTTFAGGTNWKQVSAGFAHSAALRGSGAPFEVVTFGYSNNGAIGNGINLQSSYNPGEVFGNFKNWKQVSCGYHTTAAVKTDGTLWVWGYNDYGQLGNANSINSISPITTFTGGTNWKQVSTNGYFSGHGVTAAIKTDGTLWIWGRSRISMLGNRTNGNFFEGISTPVTTFAGGTNWKQVDIGSQMVSATKIDGTLWTWGDNDNGQLGGNDFTERNTPVTTFAGGTDWKQVSCGGYHIAAVQSGINADYPLS